MSTMCDVLLKARMGVSDVQKKYPLKRKNWMRNKACTCGSGKKFKNCCWSKVKVQGTR